MPVQFAKFTEAEQEAVDAIVDRAVRMFRKFRIRRTPMDWEMDLAAVHAKIPLRLHELAEADNFNFSHDLAGIYGHLNRETGELEDFFVPRFARRDPVGAS